MIYFIALNILLLVFLIGILVSILLRSYIWARLTGEVYSGLGIALIASSIVKYNLSEEVFQFVSLLVGGLVLLLTGILMVFFSESILINAAEE